MPASPRRDGAADDYSGYYSSYSDDGDGGEAEDRPLWVIDEPDWDAKKVARFESFLVKLQTKKNIFEGAPYGSPEYPKRYQVGRKIFLEKLAQAEAKREAARAAAAATATAGDA